MRPLSSNDIESELSYAYIHAVAAHAGMACKVGGRHDDNSGVDAQIVAWGPFANGGYLREVTLNVQLKATVTPPSDDGTDLSYFLRGINRYDALRADTVSIPRILVVLFLPEEAGQWLTHTAEQLVLRRCAYWVSLRGAGPVATNGTTVYLPRTQVFDPAGLTNLAVRLSRPDFPLYHLR